MEYVIVTDKFDRKMYFTKHGPVGPKGWFGWSSIPVQAHSFTSLARALTMINTLLTHNKDLSKKLEIVEVPNV